MHSLFLKIFLWFWLTVVLIGSILVITTLITGSNSQEEAAWANRTYLSGEASRAAAIYEQEGPGPLKRHFEHLPKRPMYAYLLDEHGKEVLDQNAPRQAIELATAARNDPAVMGHYPEKDSFWAQRVIAPSGRAYTLVLFVPPLSVRTVLAALGIATLLRLGAVLVVAGFFCFWLARHITAPVVQLQEAASQIANGRLDTRVDKTIRWRRDEIGGLGLSFDRMAERIESLVGAQQRLLGVVSHELRSPLARLCVASGLVRKCPPEEQMEYLDRIDLETEHLDKLIGQLLILARIDSGADQHHKETFDLGNLIQEVAADGNFEAQSRCCTVRVDSVDSCTMMGAAENVRRAIENVVRNAIHYTKPNTDVEISLRRRGTPPASTGVIQVRDHGPGVPVTHLTKIFLPFHRVPNAGGQGTNGAGLGLAITERITRMHGGTVKAANAPDGGLIVELELPLIE